MLGGLLCVCLFVRVYYLRQKVQDLDCLNVCVCLFTLTRDLNMMPTVLKPALPTPPLARRASLRVKDQLGMLRYSADAIWGYTTLKP